MALWVHCFKALNIELHSIELLPGTFDRFCIGGESRRNWHNSFIKGINSKTESTLTFMLVSRDFTCALFWNWQPESKKTSEEEATVVRSRFTSDGNVRAQYFLKEIVCLWLTLPLDLWRGVPCFLVLFALPMVPWSTDTHKITLKKNLTIFRPKLWAS